MHLNKNQSRDSTRGVSRALYVTFLSFVEIALTTQAKIYPARLLPWVRCNSAKGGLRVIVVTPLSSYMRITSRQPGTGPRILI